MLLRIGIYGQLQEADRTVMVSGLSKHTVYNNVIIYIYFTVACTRTPSRCNA